MNARPGRPSAEEIRRALVECMTVADIDDAMGWEPGTARRRRWEEPERGGLPPADAVLGGTAIWFRATIAAWRASWLADEPPPQREDVPDDEARHVEPEPDPEPEPDEAQDDDPTPPTRQPPPSRLHGTNRSEPPADSTPVAGSSELAPGQQVVAWLHNAWRDAEVISRTHASVVVAYRLGEGPLADRQQRLGLDRVRHPRST